MKCVGEWWQDELLWEEQVYKALNGAHGFPGLRWSGESEGMYWIVMDYVGCNFERLHFVLEKEFSAQAVALFAVQMVSFIL